MGKKRDEAKKAAKAEKEAVKKQAAEAKKKAAEAKKAAKAEKEATKAEAKKKASAKKKVSDTAAGEKTSLGASAPMSAGAEKKASGKKTSGKKTSGKKTSGKKTSGKKTSGKKTSGKKTSGKKTSGKKTSGKKTSGKKTSGKKPSGAMTASDGRSVKAVIGAKTYEGIRKAIRACFPDGGTEVDDTLVDGLLCFAADLDKKGELKVLAPLRKAGMAEALAPLAFVDAAPSQDRYYVGHAIHSRSQLSPPYSAFIARLPMVRVALPQTGTRQNVPVIETAMGRLEPYDRFIASVEVAGQIASQNGITPPARVELLTPPRLDGSRFGAIATYLLYPSPGSTEPSHYILEAGLATGQARIRYRPTKIGETLVQQSGYQPTPFSAPSHYYEGVFTMKGDEPDVLHVRAYREDPPVGPYIDVDVTYTRESKAVRKNPYGITISAAARVSSIADALKQPVDLPFREVLRFIGNFLSWIERPQTDDGWNPPV